MQMVEIRPSLFLPLYVKSVAKLGLTPCRVPGQAIERFVLSEQMTQSHLSLKGSNQMYSQRTWLLWPRLSLGLGDESDASKLRHGCKTVMINETSCLESTPVFNVNSAADNGVDETDESRSGAGGQLGEVTRSSSASKKWRCILLAPVFPSYSVAILSRRIVPDLRPSASQCTASVKGDSGDSTD